MLLTKFLLTEPLSNGYVLLVNCLSGAVDFVDKKTFNCLKNKEFAKISKDVVQSLCKRGYIFRSLVDQTNFLNDLQNYYDNKREIIADYVICPTFACNLACSYCFQKDLGAKTAYLANGQISSLLEAITKIDWSTYSDKKAIQLFGGEPLLPKNKPAVNKILAYASKNDLPVVVTTNGTTVLIYKELIDRYRYTLKLAQITLDGPPGIHNKRRVPPNGKPTFDLIIKGIQYLIKRKIGVQARVNIDKANVEFLPELAVILAREGLAENPLFKCFIAPVQNHCSKEIDYRLLSENQLLGQLDLLSEKHPEMAIFSYERAPKIINHLSSVLNNNYSSPSYSYCEANRGNFYVFSPDGLIYPCTEAAGHKELAIGTFWPKFAIKTEKLRKWKGRTILTLAKCRSCTIAPLCGGGCSFAAYSINGDVGQPHCDRALEVVKDYLKEVKHDLFKKVKSSIAS